MLRGLLVFTSVLVVLGASLYQLWLKEFLTVTVGVGRVIQNIDEFPYDCRRVSHEKLEACEDLWLDDEARVLYAACAGSTHRIEWNQAMDKLNISGRRPGGSELIALDIDSPGADGFFNLRPIKPVGYIGATGAGDESLDFVGFDAEVIDSSTIHFYMVNQRPPVDAGLKYAETSHGANATIEVFEYKRGDSKMRHLRTVWSEEIYSPNNVAALGGGAFVISNDHSTKVGLRKQFDPIIGGGNIAYCSPAGKCHTASPSSAKITFPNGLARGADGLVYVPSSIDGTIKVFSVDPSTKMLQLVDTINVGMPLDNLALDANGDFYVAGGPDLIRMMKWVASPLENASPLTAFRIRRVDGPEKGKYEVTKVLEDGETKVVSGVTTVRHDAKTGRLFMGAAFAPYLVVCEPK